MKQYKATYISGRFKYTTRYYNSSTRAQMQLRDRIGGFKLLGTVAGDVFENGKCAVGPRQGGTVSVDEREVEA